MLIDESEITISAGRGGDGAVSFRHEKYVPKGGPDGGDGGRGGDIFFVGSDNVDTLFEYSRLKNFRADNGKPGKRMKRHGKDGKDLELKMPVGTQIFDQTNNELIADVKSNRDKILITKGGKGGLGNFHFKSPTNQTPRQFKPGEPGQTKRLSLKLKKISDVGLIGLPNSGKSLLLSKISAARPKVADYPFTTIEPVLGVVNFSDKNFVVCDIPGLIEGASKGRGLGHKFLRHIERTKILVHLIDAASKDPAKDYQTIRNELKEFSPELPKKEEIVVLNKSDLVKKLPTGLKFDLAISALSGENIDKLVKLIASKLSPSAKIPHVLPQDKWRG